MDKEIYALNIYVEIDGYCIDLTKKDGFDEIVQLVKDKKISSKKAQECLDLIKKGLINLVVETNA